MAPVENTESSLHEIVMEFTQINSSEVGKPNLLMCVDGILLPVWLPLSNVSPGKVAFRGIIYILSLAYLFVGVAILADKFMASIEMITSKKKVIKVKDETGKSQTVVVRVWNETVANLTLMALGCSCPEILLSSIEIIGKGFEAGEMGPGSTVGSAAFNLFVIIGVCNWVIPEGEVRKIKRVSVFLVTATWSIFAYLWLYLITSVISPGIIEVWEALMTFAFFPMTVLSAYIADRHVHIYDYISKSYRIGRNGVIVEMTTDTAEVVGYDVNLHRDRMNRFKKFSEEHDNSEEAQEFEEHRRSFIILLKNLRRKYPMLTSNQLELMATKELLERGSKSTAFYRLMTSKMFNRFGLNDQSQQAALNFTELFQEFHSSANAPAEQNVDHHVTKVFFSPGHYTVMENVGALDVTVVREGGDLNKKVFVDYTTEDGEATAGKDFSAAQGTLCFEPGVSSQTITIQIIDDELYEEDQHFYIRLFNLRSGNRNEYLCGKGDISDDAYVTTAEIHCEPAPSYSVVNDVSILDETAPPRYSVTAREILKALKTNKNLRRPSWFHYDESDGHISRRSSSSDDDEFFDAVSHIESYCGLEGDDNSTQVNDVILHSATERSREQPETQENFSKSRRVSSISEAISDEVFISYDVQQFGQFSSKGQSHATSSEKRSVEFLADYPTSLLPHDLKTGSSKFNIFPNNNQNTEKGRQNEEKSMLRLVCPSIATVMILDDDHHGIFSLTERSVCLTETVGTHSMLIIRCGGSRGKVTLPYRTEEGTAKPNRDYHHCQGDVTFEDGETEKSIPIQIMGDTFYEKDVLFYFTIGEPKLITKDGDPQKDIPNARDLDFRQFSRLSDRQRTELKGRAQLGEVTSTLVRLKESKQFKNTVDKLVSRANMSLKRGTSSWIKQFQEVFQLTQDTETHSDILFSKDAGNSLNKRKVRFTPIIKNGITLFWRLVFSSIPPECMGGGYPCFFISVIFIGVMTALIGDVASHLGCTVGLKDSVTALAFVSLGTSLPDLFASKVSAVQDQHADASISNVTGSNAVNVFLGVGVAWSLAAVFHSYNGTQFHVEAGTLAFSVTLYCAMAIFAILLLLIRRSNLIGGELGGPKIFKRLTTFLMLGFFCAYILLSSFEAYGLIHGF